MNGRTLGAFIAAALFLAAGYVVKAGQGADSTLLHLLGVGIGVVVIICVFKQYNPFRKLWIGPTYEQMRREAQELEDTLWNGENDAHLTTKDRNRLMKREQKVRRMMAEYRKLNDKD
ncbi:hypothetical protein [Halomonas caseinilytica]|uniref:Uncharacterized protein n=1 Tax=Halomonas caseinilytica TaxID=438744 RepID=A0A1M6YAB6_9GAMM|nr:hypothetical protein [Halomonas caseinilytica]SHL15052.1 hypothetical protein SAMN05192556_108108 [Halomonas caseinilytica]